MITFLVIIKVDRGTIDEFILPGQQRRNLQSIRFRGLNYHYLQVKFFALNRDNSNLHESLRNHHVHNTILGFI